MNRFNFFQRMVWEGEDGGGSGAASAPAAPAAPSAPSSSPAPSGGDTPLSGETRTPGDSSSGGEFSGLGMPDDDFDTVVIDTTTPTTPAAAPAAPPLPANVPPAAATPAVPAAPAAAPAVPPATVPAQPPAAPQGTGAQAPAAPPSDPVSLLNELSAHRDGVIAALAADSRFQLSPDEATLLETDPGKAVPQLLAKTFYQATNAALTYINNFVPQMITRHLEGTRMQNERETTFYSKFPALKKDVHGSDVLTYARLFRAQSPNMPMDQFYTLVGAAVMAKNGIAGSQASAGVNGAHPPQPAVHAPPFAPAAPGATVKTTPVEENPFAGLGKDWDDQ